MRWAPRHRILLLSLAAAGLLTPCVSCDEPAVRESVLLAFDEDGRIRLSVETAFRQGRELTDKDRDEILRRLDLYELGRDPWLRGLERAGAKQIAHECQGPEGAPAKIDRGATLPSVESLVDVMPDPIANFRLWKDDAVGTVTLEIVHIDIPESIRDNRRRLEREIAAFGKAMFRLAERNCDVYDYLAGHVDRREEVLGAMEDEKIGDLVSPEEAAMIERLNAGMEGMGIFLGMAADPGAESPAIARMSFSAFDHDFCVKLPADPLESVGFTKETEADRKHTWCIERRVTEDLVLDLWSNADPPLDSLGKVARDDPVSMASLPFTCVRYDDEAAIEAKLWERILPLPSYELTWREPAPPDPATPMPSE